MPLLSSPTEPASGWSGTSAMTACRVDGVDGVAMRDVKDTAFEMAASAVRYGSGVTREVGMDVADRGLRRVMVVTDPIVGRLPPVETVLDSLRSNGVESVVYDRVRIEPSDASFIDAIGVANRESCDGFVAVGGGSVID